MYHEPYLFEFFLSSDFHFWVNSLDFLVFFVNRYGHFVTGSSPVMEILSWVNG